VFAGFFVGKKCSGTGQNSAHGCKSKFDTLVLDLGVMMHWKKCRLPGTEDMDEEYKMLTKKAWWTDYMAVSLGFR